MAWYIIADSFDYNAMHSHYNSARHWALHKADKKAFHAFLYGSFKYTQVIKDFNIMYNMGSEL